MERWERVGGEGTLPMKSPQALQSVEAGRTYTGSRDFAKNSVAIQHGTPTIAKAGTGEVGVTISNLAWGAHEREGTSHDREIQVQ